MARHRDIPELIEQFMNDSGSTECWVTVSELRDHFHLAGPVSPAISGFLQRIHSGSFASFPYRVDRIEKVPFDGKPNSRVIRKYLVAKRPVWRDGRPCLSVSGEPGQGDHCPDAKNQM